MGPTTAPPRGARSDRRWLIWLERLMDRPSVLIIEADDHLRRTVTSPLRGRGVDVTEVDADGGVVDCLRETHPHLVIVGSSRGGLRVVRLIRECDRAVPVVFLAVDGSEELAIGALRAGVNDYLKHPASPEKLLESVERCLGARSAAPPVANSGARVADLAESHRLIGDSASMCA